MRAWWSALLVPQNARELAEEIGALVGELGRAEPVDRIGPGLLANCGELVADLVDRLSQDHAGPLAVDELHRVSQPPVAVHELAHRGALGAMRAAVDRRVPARLLADPHAVCDLGDHRAADRAMRADVLADGDLRARGRRRAGLRLAHAGERQRAERGETAGDEPRAAQEANGGRGAPSGWPCSAPASAPRAALAFRSPDQHGRLLSPDSG